MELCDLSDRFCVVGGGACGLTALKNLTERGIPAEALEREDDVGGNWYYGSPASSLIASTHLISSKRQTEFTDFPMPGDYPPYPSHAQALAYLRDYARHFDLYQHIRFGQGVTRIEPVDGGKTWQVTVAGEEPRRYRGVVIANGHHWDPLVPQFPGNFAGQILHARDYKTPDLLRGRRVLVVGAGNSGCDIAVEAAQHATAAFLSLRRGYHFLPKFLLGKPVDAGDAMLHRWRLPLWLRRWITSWLVYIAVGPLERYGLPTPDHALFETHPIINSQLLYWLGHGAIGVRPNIAELAADRVRFVDGREEQVDLIILATGYKLSFPFIDSEHLAWRDGRPQLFLNAFHPRYHNLFVCGLIQPNGGLWPLADWQAKLMAAYLVARDRRPQRAAAFDRRKQEPPPDVTEGIRYLDSPRHLLEVEYFAYRDQLAALVAEMDRP